MKKLSTLFAVVGIAAMAFAQNVVYTENIGTTAATGNPTATAFTAYQQGTPIVYTGTADIRTTYASTSSDYTGASGGNNVMVNANNEFFQIEGINTSTYTGLALSFGQRKGASAANNELLVQVSEDGTNWTTLSYTRQSGNGTANWQLVQPTGTIPATSNLRIRFTGTNNTEWRLDDIKVTATGVLGTNEQIKTAGNFIKNTNVQNEIFFNDKAEIKIYNALGQMVKTAQVNSSNPLNVSELEKGIYTVTGVVDDKTVSQRVIKN